MSTVLVTGANGYIGPHVVEALVDLGFDVVAATRRPTAFSSGSVRCVVCDVLEEAGEEGLFERLGSPDTCIHLAYRNGFVHNAPTHLEDIAKHYAFVGAMARSGCERVAVMGSMHEVGYHEGAITSSTPCSPLSMYGIAKNALREAVMGVMAPQVDASLRWLRGYYIYGDDLRSSSVFGKMVLASREGRRTFPFTSGTNKCDFIHVDDLATQIAVAATTPLLGTEVMNCCTGVAVSLGCQALSFIRANGLDLELEYGVFPDRPYDSPVVYGDAAPIRALLRQVQETWDGPGIQRIARALESMDASLRSPFAQGDGI